MAVAYWRGRASPHASRAEPDVAPASATAPARTAARCAGGRAGGRPPGPVAAVAVRRALVEARRLRARLARAGACTGPGREGAPDARDDAPRLGAGLPVVRFGGSGGSDDRAGAQPRAAGGGAGRAGGGSDQGTAAYESRADEGARHRRQN